MVDMPDLRIANITKANHLAHDATSPPPANGTYLRFG